MDNEFGSFKELYDVILRATSDIQIGGELIEEGEVIAYFDKIQVAGLQTIQSIVTANGGWDNRPHVFWETTKEIDLEFSQGVFSKTQLALATNSKMYKIENNSEVLLSRLEKCESGEEGQFSLKYTPVGKIFVYDKFTGQKLNIVSRENNYIIIEDDYKDVIVFYQYNYANTGKVLRLGQELLNGYVSFEGKTREKDDISGKITTGIIKIPKLRIVGGLSIHLGAQANPVVANFRGIGVPTGEKKGTYVTELFFLDNDIDSSF